MVNDSNKNQINYDIGRHAHLLKIYYASRMKLSDDSIMKLSDEEKSELATYNIYVEKQRLYSMREFFESLFNDFFSKKISGQDFHDRVLKLQRSLQTECTVFQSRLVLGMMNTKNAQNSFLTNNAKDFSSLLSYLYHSCDEWEEDEYETEEFSQFVKEGFLRYQEILNNKEFDLK